MKIYFTLCTILAATFCPASVYAGASGYWEWPPSYNAVYCPSATSVEPGCTVWLRARKDSCASGIPAEDLDTYKDIHGNPINPPPPESRIDNTFNVSWTVTGPNAYSVTGSGTEWAWVSPCVPGQYTVSWTLSNSRQSGDPRKDPTVSATKGTITVTALPTVSIAVPACDGEYVSGTTRIKAYAGAPGGISSVKFYVDGVFKGLMYQEDSYWRFDWNTAGTGEGAHTMKVVAANSCSCTNETTREVYAHPSITLTQAYFEQDHPLWDRCANIPSGGAKITRPQWTPNVNKPFAYTRNSEMKVRPRLESTNVSGSVNIRYEVNLTWSDSATHNADKTASGVTLPHDQLAYFPTSRTTVNKYTCQQGYTFYVRKCSTSDWCPAGTASAAHYQVYHTLANPQAPWGMGDASVWSAVLDEACTWASGQSTESGVLTEITKGLHSRTTGQYMYNGGQGSFTRGTIESQELYLNCFLNTQQRQGDCKDFANYLSLLASAVGVNLHARRTTPPGGFITNEYYPAGRSGSLISNFVFHQYGLFGNVYDAAIRLTSGGNPPSNMVEENGTASDYESTLVQIYNLGGNQWHNETPQKPTIVKDWCPTIYSGFWYPTVGTSSAYIAWSTNVPAPSSIHWDTTSHEEPYAYANHSVEYSPYPLEIVHAMSIGGLSSGTRYYYRVQSGCAVSPEVSFMTDLEP